MEFLKNFDLKSIPLMRILGIVVVGIVVLTLAVWFLSFALRTALGTGSYNSYSQSAPYMSKSVAMDSMGYEEAEMLSTRNIMPPVEPGYASGDAEAFEITQYNGTIRTGDLDGTCDVLEGLKVPEYIIFEDANRQEHNCYYKFKVENEHVDEVLGVIEGLKPETFNSNTHTIKMLVDDYTSEVEILKNKLASVEETLSDAQTAYDELQRLATQTRDAETLAKIIDSKINLIERLTNERISIKERIDRINRSKAEQLDRLAYTFFNVSAYERLIVDVKAIKESWVSEVQRFVREFNGVLQEVTLGLGTFMMRLVQTALYFIIALLVVKYGWRFTKKLWKS